MNYNGYPQFNTNFGNEGKLIRVNGMDGAKAYQMMPNSSVALFDANDDFFYIKTTDGAGFPSIRCFKFEEVQQSNNLNNNFVTKDDFEKFKGELYGKLDFYKNEKENIDRPKDSERSEGAHEERVEGEIVDEASRRSRSRTFR